MVTAKRLREVLEYDPLTGVFTWIKAGKHTQWLLGREAGRVHKKNGYREICVDGRLYFAHRLAWLYMTGQWPRDQIDHRNRQRSDNRWANLREADNSTNGLNRSNVSGVSFYRKGGYARWRARIHIGGKTHSLGYFNTRELAEAASQSARLPYLGVQP